jgi:hypothetical protein
MLSLCFADFRSIFTVAGSPNVTNYIIGFAKFYRHFWNAGRVAPNNVKLCSFLRTMTPPVLVYH